MEQLRMKLFFAFAFALYFIAIVFNCVGIATYSWANESSVQAGVTKDAGWGLIGSCITFENPANNNQTLNDVCDGYGSGFSDFPQASWGAATVFLGAAIITAFLAVVLMAVGFKFKICQTLALSGCIFATVFNIVVVFIFPVGFGSTYTVNTFIPIVNSTDTIPYSFDISVCSGSSGAYDIGSCSIGYSFGLVIGACICLIFGSIFFVIAKNAKESHEKAAETKGKKGYGGYA